MVMRNCWEMSPNDRPSFKELHKATSEYIEHIAGYLGLGYNPFAGVRMLRSTIKLDNKQREEEAAESEVNIQVIPSDH